jgi:hypothetical protein
MGPTEIEFRCRTIIGVSAYLKIDNKKKLIFFFHGKKSFLPTPKNVTFSAFKLQMHSVENGQKNGILHEISESHIFHNFFYFPTPDTLKVGLTPKFDHSSRWAVRNQASKFRVFKTKIIRNFKFQIFFLKSIQRSLNTYLILIFTISMYKYNLKCHKFCWSLFISCA